MSNTLRKPLNMRDERIQKALQLTFAGRLTREQIAENCSVSTRTLYYWLEHPDFIAALDDLRKDFRKGIEGVTFADKARRIVHLDYAAKIALNELEIRPLLKEVRPTRDGEIVNEAFNNTAMAEFRSALADIAAELGERKNVTELSGSLEVKNDAEAFERRLIDTLERIRAASPADGTDARG
ncbi:MAG: phBC6A51 family helix-turn-helix protein [Ktedonobacterales bacterium]